MSQLSSVPHSRTTSTSSTSSTYRLFPRCPKSTSPRPRSRKSTHARHASLSIHPVATTTNILPAYTQSTHHRRHTLQTPTDTLTTSIERTTLPLLQHLTAQLPLVRGEQDRVRVRSMIQRQEAVLLLSSVLKGWDGDDEDDFGVRSEGSDDEEPDDVYQDAVEELA